MSDIGPKLMMAFLVAMPFLFVGALCRELAIETKNSRLGWGLFAAAFTALVVNLGWGYWSSQSYMAKRMWTAATLSFVWAIPRSALIVLVIWSIRGKIGNRTSGGANEEPTSGFDDDAPAP
jgi:small-conductance mechanosensitive channel